MRRSIIAAVFASLGEKGTNPVFFNTLLDGGDDRVRLRGELDRVLVADSVSFGGNLVCLSEFSLDVRQVFLDLLKSYFGLNRDVKNCSLKALAILKRKNEYKDRSKSSALKPSNRLLFYCCVLIYSHAAVSASDGIKRRFRSKAIVQRYIH